MAGELIVPTTTKPTFWNRDAAVGFFSGTFLPIPVPFLGGIIGAAIGGVLGKQRMTQDLAVGKLVGKPTFLNKTLLIGAGLGYSIVGAIGGALILTGTVPFLAGLAITGAAAIVATLVGGTLGAINGKARLTRDYNEAQAYVESQEASLAQAVSPQRGHSQAYQVSPEEAALLETRLAEGKTSRFTEKMNAEQAMQQSAAR